MDHRMNKVKYKVLFDEKTGLYTLQRKIKFRVWEYVLKDINKPRTFKADTQAVKWSMGDAKINHNARALFYMGWWRPCGSGESFITKMNKKRDLVIDKSIKENVG